MDYFAALNAFVEAADGNNFSRAAERLGIKASTVSRYVKDLEQDLGIALFNRSTRTLHLTEGGETFLLHARRVLLELEHAKAATSALNQHPRGILKLNLPPAFARHHVLPWLNEFLASFPEVRVELVLEDTHVNLIHAGADLAIRIGALADSTLKARKIADERQLLVVSRDFFAQHPKPASPTQLVGYRRIASADADCALSFVSAQGTCRADGGDTLHINDLDAQLIAVRRGLGFAVLPDWLVAHSLQTGELREWLGPWQVAADHPTSLWFVYPPKRIVSSKVRCFIDFMVERMGTRPYWQRLS